MKKRDYVAAERTFVSAAVEDKSSFPYDVVCLAAEKATAEGLAFTIQMQRRLRDRLAHREEKPCRAISWAVEHGSIDVARIAVRNGETFGMWALKAVVSKDFDIELTEGQRIEFFELAVQHSQVPRDLMPSLLATATREGSDLLAEVIEKCALDAGCRRDKSGKMSDCGSDRQ